MVGPAHLIPKGPPDAILNLEPAPAIEALKVALEIEERQARYNAILDILAKWPSFLEGWARLGENSTNTMEAYAAFRVGYHRGLDKLRGTGWKGSGMVRWEHVENRGFLLCLNGLRQTAQDINETEEAERCQIFLHQLDPEWPPPELSS